MLKHNALVYNLSLSLDVLVPPHHKPLHLLQGRLWAIINMRNAWKLSCVHVILCCRLLFYFVTSTKDTAFPLYLKVSFGQPARQESDKNCHKTLENHSIPCLQGIFSSSIMELQKCSPAHPNRVSKQNHILQTITLKHWTFGFWLKNEFVVEWCWSSIRLKYWFALVSERAAWLVQMVSIHSWKQCWYRL